MPEDAAAHDSLTLPELRLRLDEALQREAAISEVLGTINASNADLSRVFAVMIEKAVQLCAASYGYIWSYDGERARPVASFTGQTFADWLGQREAIPGEVTPLGQALLHREIVHVADATAHKGYGGSAGFRELVDRGGVRTLLHVPLLKDGSLFGIITVYRQECQAFSDQEITLLESFAVQAVIAMENARLVSETRQALEHQTATAEVLRVINSSLGDLQPVFASALESATRLCDAAFGILWLTDGEHFQAASLHGAPEGYAAVAKVPHRPLPTNPLGRLLRGERLTVSLDVAAEESYRSGDPVRRALVDLGGARSVVQVALIKDEALLGSLTVYRQEVRPFSDSQVALLQNFAAQVVVAMENGRLLSEQREALAQQTAMADILQVINSSPGNLGPVFELMLEKALDLCQASQGYLHRFDGRAIHLLALRGAWDDVARRFAKPIVIEPESVVGRMVRSTSDVVHIADITDDDIYRAGVPSRFAEWTGARTALWIALRKDTELVGAFTIYRQEVRPFSDKQVELMRSFAAQAVVAMENARLMTETREALNKQTATAEILRVISSSATDIQPVFDAIVARAAQLCEAEFSGVLRLEDGLLHLVATNNLSADETAAWETLFPRPAAHGYVVGRAMLQGRAVQVEDVLADPDYDPRTREVLQSRIGYRTFLGVPILREGKPIGVIGCARREVRLFTPAQIDLVSTFADQAVIAIENVRLFEELRERQAELRVTFDTMGDGVAMFDSDHRLGAWNRNFQALMGLSSDWLSGRPSYAGYLGLLAERGEFGTENVEAALTSRLADTERELRLERTRADGSVIEVRRNAVAGGGFVLIYSDVTQRRRSEEAVRQARDVAESALRDLKAAQASLIHAEKMASLGQLTAGIAHEIKNPLNFVNNFAGLSVELLGELKEVVALARLGLSQDHQEEIDETLDLLTTNLDKIRNHGRRADGIVRSMLLHSRGGSGDRQRGDINAVLEEALILAYHGARAQDQSFNVTLERDLQSDIVPIEIVPQDVMRVFLNLIGNGFYAMAKRRRQEGEGFRPTLKVTTRDMPEAVEIVVRDNGVGIPPQSRERLFQPFFTTKPTGEGTGLGLSISYDIVTQQHGGSIVCDSKVGEFAEFTIRLPRRENVPAAAGRPAWA